MTVGADPLPAPLVTVIVATYNQSAALRLALDSILCQDYPHFEVWVVGDCCTDDSAAVVAALSDNRLHWINLEHNTGNQFAPNNVGLQRARGQYVAYLGHDDLWFPWHLSSLVACIEAANADFAHAMGTWIDASGPTWIVGPTGHDASFGNAFAPPCLWLHRRDISDMVGPWRDPNRLPWPTDVDFHRRAYLAGKAFAFSPRMSALKFAAGAFRLYGSVGLTPQRPYSNRLRDAPEAMERQILAEMSLTLAHRVSSLEQPPSVKTGARVFLCALLRYVSDDEHPVRIPEVALRLLLDTVGRSRMWPMPVNLHTQSDRWMMRPYMHWRHQRYRSRHRRERGLPDADSKPRLHVAYPKTS